VAVRIVKPWVNKLPARIYRLRRLVALLQVAGSTHGHKAPIAHRKGFGLAESGVYSIHRSIGYEQVNGLTLRLAAG
jgi:hypothetical protein